MTRIVIINHYGSTTGTGMGGRHHYFARELARKGHTVTLVAARSHHLIRDDIDSGRCHVNSPNLQVGKLFVDQAACAADFHASNASSRW